jgi:hypothetical protein
MGMNQKEKEKCKLAIARGYQEKARLKQKNVQ